MSIKPNTVVSLTYELHTTNEEGQQVFATYMGFNLGFI